MRRHLVLVGLAAAVLWTALPARPSAAADGPGSGDVKKAEARLRDAQRKANAAVKGLEEARRALEDAEEATSRAHAELAAARKAYDDAAAQVRATVVRTYTSGGSEVRVTAEDVNLAARGRGYLAAATGVSADQLDELRARRSDLDRREAAVKRRLAAQQTRVAAYEKLQGQLAGSLDRIGRELDEARRREAELIRQGQIEAARRAAEERRRLEELQRQESRKRPAPTGGAPANKGPWVCPVQGGATFTNDYGFPRSGGRRHQGNDLFAPRGTPVVASVSGTWTKNANRLGGINYFLRGDDGNTYYGAHMSGYAGTPEGRISQGTVIGYVGTSGNARGTSPHLHFEIRPGGGSPVNPYPTTSRYC